MLLGFDSKDFTSRPGRSLQNGIERKNGSQPNFVATNRTLAERKHQVNITTRDVDGERE